MDDSTAVQLLKQPSHRSESPFSSNGAWGRLFRGSEVSVRCGRVRPTELPRTQSHAQTKLILTFEPAAGLLRRHSSTGGTEQELVGRQIACIAAGVMHEVRWKREAEVIEVYLEPRFTRRLPEQNVTSVIARQTMPDTDADHVIWELAGMIGFLSAEEPTDASLITGLGALLGGRLFLRHGEPSGVKSGPRLTTEQRVRLDTYIQTHIGMQISVPELAKVVAISVSHFGLLCRNTTGKSPTEYTRECRLWKAHAMARTGNFRRGEIARACGFYDASHLNREFRRLFKRPLVSW